MIISFESGLLANGVSTYGGTLGDGVGSIGNGPAGWQVVRSIREVNLGRKTQSR